MTPRLCSLCALFLVKVIITLGLVLAPGSLAAANDLRVIGKLPEGEVQRLTQIAVRFSEPMVPLGQMQVTPQTAPLKLSTPSGLPVPAGSFRWLDPTTLAYSFDQALEKPLVIDVKVPAGVKAVSGNRLRAGSAWQVATPPLKLWLKRTYPDDRRLQKYNETLFIESNYPLDAAKMLGFLKLSAKGKTYRLELHPNYLSAVTVQDSLPPDTTLTLNIAPGVTAKAGGVPADKFAFELKTYERLRVERLAASEWRPEKINPGSKLSIRFNNPVRFDELMRHISISPPLKRIDTQENRSYGNERGEYNHDLPFAWEPGTYTVSLGQELRDASDTALAAPFSQSLTIHPYPPSLETRSGFSLEKSPGGAYPVITRNASALTMKLRYLPWQPKAYPLLAVDDDNTWRLHYDFNPADYPGAREVRLILPISGEKDLKNAYHQVDLAKALGFASVLDIRGPVFVRFAPEALQEGDSEYPEGGGANKFSTADVRQVTDLALVFRVGDNGGLAWVTSIDSGRPVAGAEVSLADINGAPLWQGKTGPEGTLALPSPDTLPDSLRFCIVSKDDDRMVEYLSPKNGRSASFFGYGGRESRAMAVAVLPQLPVYQPGQTAHFLVYVKETVKPGSGSGGQNSQPGLSWRAAAGREVAVSVLDGNNKAVHTFAGQTNEYGSIASSLDLPAGAGLGRYRVVVRSGEQKTEAYAFGLASFRTPEFKVDLLPPADTVQGEQGAALTAAVRAEYFSGAKLPGGQVTLRSSGRSLDAAPGRLRGYATTSSPHRPFHDYFFLDALGAALDKEGQARLSLSTVPCHDNRATRVSLYGEVTDASGLVTQGEASFTVHPAAWYVGLRSPYLARPDKTAEVELKVATWDNLPLFGVNITLTAERALSPEPTVWPQESGAYETVWERDLFVLDPEGGRFAVSFPQSGLYRLRAGIVDPDGREHLTETAVSVPGEDDASFPWHDGGDRLSIVAEDKEYVPGETAQLMLRNPYPAGAVALVSLERDDVLRSFVLEIAGKTPVIDLPLIAADAPFVKVNVALRAGRTAPPPQPGNPENRRADSGAPQYRNADILLKVKKISRPLLVGVKPESRDYRPGGQAAVNVTVTDEAGRGRRTQVSLLAVDNRMIHASGNSGWYRLERAFSPSYRSDVRGGIFMHLVNLDLPAFSVQRQPSAGGSGPEAVLTPAFMMSEGHFRVMPENPPYLRDDFSPSAYWLAQGESDDQGRLRAEFALPGNLTSYTVVAVAADKEESFAYGTAEIQAGQPLQILSALPRFLTEGDRLEARILVQNNSAAPQTINVSAQVEGGRLDKQTESILVPAGQSGLVTFPLIANALPGGEPGQLSLTVQAAMGEETDAARFVLPVKAARSLTQVAAAGLLQKGESANIAVKLPDNLAPRSSLTVGLAPSPVAGTPMIIRQILDCPDFEKDSLEMKASRAWVLTARLGHGPLLGLEAEAADRREVQEIMAALAAAQSSDGAFPVWPGTGGSFYLTAYILLVNEDAAGLGLGLPAEATDKAAAFLSRHLLQPGLTYGLPLWETAGPGGQKNLGADSLALGLAVLAKASPGQATSLYYNVKNYYQKHENLGPFGAAALLLALDRLPGLSGRDAEINETLRLLERSAVPTATELHFGTNVNFGHWRSLGSNLRDNALALLVLSKARPDYPRLDGLARWTALSLGLKSTLSSQEAAYGLNALAAYLEVAAADGKSAASAFWNGEKILEQSFSGSTDAPVSLLIPSARLAAGSALDISVGEGGAYYTARLSYAPESLPVEAENAGFFLRRSLDGPGNKTWKMGDTATVTLSLTVLERRHGVLLFDPFPAGFEPFYASRADLEERGQAYSQVWQRRETREDGLLLYAESLEPGTYTYTYTLRAAAPGSFIHKAARAAEMFSPEVFGRTPASRLAIVP